jgi:diadenosine tetraphosphate (Ap4A) HIT family hydrolase
MAQPETKADCIFCKIVTGEMPCHTVWEDEQHLAFLSIFPNTEGFTVVIPKQHYGSYAFAQSDEVLANLVLATKKVATILDNYFEDVTRCGMFFEGYGVDHLHSKLSPMHGGGEFSTGKSIEIAKPDIFFEQYPGYLSSHDAKRANDEQLSSLAAAIRQSAQDLV